MTAIATTVTAGAAAAAAGATAAAAPASVVITLVTLSVSQLLFLALLLLFFFFFFALRRSCPSLPSTSSDLLSSYPSFSSGQLATFLQPAQNWVLLQSFTKAWGSRLSLLLPLCCRGSPPDDVLLSCHLLAGHLVQQQIARFLRAYRLCARSSCLVRGRGMCRHPELS